MIFNLCETLGGISQYEQHVAALLEVLDKRFTGAGSIGLTLAQDKELSKKIFQFHSIRYPKFSCMDAGKVEWSDELNFPLFVKPLNEDASIGIDSGSIVHNVKELMERISYIQTEFNAPALIEEFIEGCQFWNGIFRKCPKALPELLPSEAKWDEESVYKNAPEVFPVDIPEPVYAKMQETAIQAFKSLKLRDYGRVDMRVRHVVKDTAAKSNTGEATKTDFENWEFFVIEVNPNPYLVKKSELAMAAGKHGLNYPDLIEKIIEMAMERTQ